jgi:CheY-like chemotaxis protein
MGFEVLTSENGEAALKILTEVNDRGLKIDAVILDLTVPGGMGGKDIISDIRKTNPNIIIIASSGYSEDPVMSNPGSFGFTDSLAKPYRINQLLEILSKHLNFN